MSLKEKRERERVTGSAERKGMEEKSEGWEKARRLKERKWVKKLWESCGFPWLPQ